MSRIIDMTVGWEMDSFTCSAQALADATTDHPRYRYPALNMSRRSIFRALDRLKDLGLLDAARRQNGIRLQPIIPNLMKSLEPGWNSENFKPTQRHED